MFWHRFCLLFNEYINWELKMNNILKKLKKVNGQSLAEFAVTTAMMATLATTAAPKFSGVGEGAKEKKTMSDIDKILKAANNFYNTQVTEAGRADSQVKKNLTRMFHTMVGMDLKNLGKMLMVILPIIHHLKN